MSYEMTGIIKVIKDTEQVTNTFNKREFVVDDEDERYPQVIQFEMVQDKCSVLDNYKTGDRVKVGFNIRGREWTSPQGDVRYFVSLNAWRLDKIEAGSEKDEAPGGSPPPFESASVADEKSPFTDDGGSFDSDEDIDDIPF